MWTIAKKTIQFQAQGSTQSLQMKKKYQPKTILNFIQRIPLHSFYVNLQPKSNLP